MKKILFIKHEAQPYEFSSVIPQALFKHSLYTSAILSAGETIMNEIHIFHLHGSYTLVERWRVGDRQWINKQNKYLSGGESIMEKIKCWRKKKYSESCGNS